MATTTITTTTDTTTPTTIPATTFHLFPLLPYELCALIWQFTVLPREVDVYIREPPLRRNTLSSTPVPGPLQACRESRHLLTRDHLANTTSTSTSSTSSSHNTNSNFIGYEKAFQFSVSPLTTPNPGYVWVNFALDTISITSTDLHCFTKWTDMLPFKNRIKRLKLEREYSPTYGGEYFAHNEVNQIDTFEGLEECHFVCLDGVWAFEGITEYNYFPCEKENVWLIDPDNAGERMRAVDLDKKCREERGEGEEAREWVSDEEEEENDEVGSDAGSSS